MQRPQYIVLQVPPCGILGICIFVKFKKMTKNVLYIKAEIKQTFELAKNILISLV
jgi:hypothetical protein